MSETFISMVSCAADTKTRDISVEKVLEGIRSGGKNLKGQIQQIRNRFEAELTLTGGDRKAAKLAVEQLKKALPAVIWSGQYSDREHPAADKLQEHSGLLPADLDELGQELPRVREQLQTSPHLWALFISPTGNGLKAVFRVPADASKHAGSYRAVEKHVRELTGVQIDESGKDVSRLCFLSYDPELYHNPNATQLEPLPEPEKPKPAFNSSGEVNLSERQRIAAEMFGDIEWDSDTHGFLTCPGKHLHTRADGERDCEIHLDGAPNIHCFHGHCKGIEAGVNRELQSRIGKAEFVPAPDIGEPVEPDKGQAAIIARLAALPPIEYDRIRKDEAKKLRCRVTILDELVANRRPPSVSATGELQGRTLNLLAVEPWPEPVNGAEVLHEAAETCSLYVALPDGAADALALWIAHTHCFQAFQCSPRLNVTSPEKQCGKSTLRDVIATLVPRPLPTENLSVAVLFRVIEKHRPTMLADECDAWINDNEELRGLLNAGHKRGGQALRCEGENNEVRAFNVFAPAVLCGIGVLPGTLHDRSIPIRLERAKPGELRQRFDSRHVEREAELRRKLARFVADNMTRLELADPKLPGSAFNRLADNWRPLFAIAGIAGGDWQKRCATAFSKLTSREDLDAQGIGTMLLSDTAVIFAAEDRDELPSLEDALAAIEAGEAADKLPSALLAARLAELEGRPWAEWGRQRKPISPNQLANQLRRFGISPGGIRVGDETLRGYVLEDFREDFERYLPKPLLPECNTATTLGETPISEVQQAESVLHPENGPLQRECCTVAPQKAVLRENKEVSDESDTIQKGTYEL